MSWKRIALFVYACNGYRMLIMMQYLQNSGSSVDKDMLLIFYLQRARYAEANKWFESLHNATLGHDDVEVYCASF